MIGPDPAQDIQNYAGNSIHDNTYNVALNIYGTTVSNLWANAVWWGAAPPQMSTFQIGPGSHIYGLVNGDREYYLSSDPWYGYPLPSALPVELAKDQTPTSLSLRASAPGPQPRGADGTPGLIPVDSLYKGIKLRLDGKVSAAKDFFLYWLANHPNDLRADVELYNCYSDETCGEITKYFESLPTSAAESNMLLLSYLYMKQGNVISAKDVNNRLISANANTLLAQSARLNNFYIALFHENDAQTAASILKDVMSGRVIANPIEISIAQEALSTYINPQTGGVPYSESMPGQLEQSAVQVHEDTNTIQNFPNPFNPATVIQFVVRSTGFVEGHDNSPL